MNGYTILWNDNNNVLTTKKLGLFQYRVSLIKFIIGPNIQVRKGNILLLYS